MVCFISLVLDLDSVHLRNFLHLPLCNAMTNRKLKDPVLNTNFLFFGNAILYSYGQFYSLSIAMVLAGLFSFMYHLFMERETVYKFLDIAFAKIALLLIFIHIAFMSDMKYILLCTLWLLISLFIKEYASRFENDSSKYELFHSLWHVFVCFGNVLVFFFLSI